MTFSFLSKVLVVLKLASVLDSSHITVFDDNLNIGVFTELLTDWFQNLTSTGIHKSLCDSLPLIPVLEFVDKLLKSWMCNNLGTNIFGHPTKYLNLLLQFLKDFITVNRPTAATPVCPNSDYRWKTPAMFVMHSDNGENDIATFDLIDGKYVLRKKSIGIRSDNEYSLLVPNAAGDQLYMIDYENIFVITKEPCSDVFKQTFTQNSRAYSLILNPSQEYLLVALANATIVVYRLESDGTITMTKSIDVPSEIAALVPKLTQITFHPTSKNLVAVNDAQVNLVHILNFDDSTGSLTNTRVTFQLNELEFTASPFIFSNDGQFVYATYNRIQIVRVIYDRNGMITKFTKQEEADSIAVDKFCSILNGMKPLLHPNLNYMYFLLKGCNAAAVYKVDPILGTIVFLQIQERVNYDDSATITPDGNHLLLLDGSQIKSFVIESSGKLGPMTTIDTELKPYGFALTRQNN